MPFIKRLTRLYHSVAPSSAGIQRSYWWQGPRAQKRLLRRALTEPRDTVEISAEAMFRFVALKFDPQHITFEEAWELAHILRVGGAINRRTELAFNRGVARVQKGVAPGTPDVPFNLMTVLEERIAGTTPPWYGKSHLSVALDILRTIDIRRRGLPSVRHRHT